MLNFYYLMYSSTMSLVKRANLMRTVTIEEAEGHLAELAEFIDEGEEIEVIRPGKPSLYIASTKPSVTTPKVAKKRKFGQFANQKWHMSDDFDEPLPDSYWEGK